MQTDVAWIALGSNVGHRGAALRRLREALSASGVTVEAASDEILTRAHGVTAQQDFHNQVVRLHAPEARTPQQWLQLCKDAERLAGRKETYRWGPRVADADVLALGAVGEISVDDDLLTVPHRELRNRTYLRELLRQAGLQEPALSSVAGPR